MESKIVYVPQGKSGRFTRASQSLGITGLYTDGFTTCNILAYISPSKLLLIHADLQTDPTEEEQWIKEELQEVVLIYKPEYERVVTSRLRPQLHERFGAKLKVMAIPEGHESVYLCFDENPEGFPEPVKTYPMEFTPPNLIRHPLEQQLLAVQKIEQIIGLRAKNKTGKSRKKYMNVFDGNGWEVMADYETEVDESHMFTKQEMRVFSAQDSYTALVLNLMELIRSFDPKEVPIMGNINDLAQPIAFEIEGYLNNFDAVTLFKRNIQALFNKSSPSSVFLLESPGSKEDGDLSQQVSKESTPEGIVHVFERYDATAPDTGFKQEVMKDFTSLKWQYDARMIYTQAAQEREALSKRFISLTEKARPHFQAKRFVAAVSLFLEALTVASRCFLKNDPNFATAHWNLGRARQRLGDVEKAHSYIQTALVLREAYQPKNQELIKATRKALEECKEMIKKSATPVAVTSVRKGS